MSNDPILSSDYYKDEKVSTKRIGDEFAACHFTWNFPGQRVQPVNGSILTDIEYSFDGVNVAGRLMRGTDALAGGEDYLYKNTNWMEIWFRRAHDANGDVEQPGEEDIPYRLFVDRHWDGGR